MKCLKHKRYYQHSVEYGSRFCFKFNKTWGLVTSAGYWENGLIGTETLEEYLMVPKHIKQTTSLDYRACIQFILNQ